MTGKQRIVNQVLGREVDCIPTVGGWIQGLRTLAELAGLTVRQYLDDPMAAVIKAYRTLGVDGMLPGVFVPQDPDQIRGGHVAEADFVEHVPEELRDRAEALPDCEGDIRAGFDVAVYEQAKREEYVHFGRLYADIAVFPTDFSCAPNFMLYGSYGYGAYLQAVALYPEHVGRIYRETGIHARMRNEVLVRLIAELDLPPVLLTGQDICTNSGPLCSPWFLREQYWPHTRYALEPLLDAGIRPIWHSDGNIMPIADDIIGVGFAGFQGLQYECGVDPWKLMEYTTVFGERPLLMAGLHITRTLPYGCPRDVREEIDWLVDCTDGGRGLFLFPSNVIGPEVPSANIAAGYEYCHQVNVPADRPTAGRKRPWPFGAKHPDG